MVNVINKFCDKLIRFLLFFISNTYRNSKSNSNSNHKGKYNGNVTSISVRDIDEYNYSVSDNDIMIIFLINTLKH